MTVKRVSVSEIELETLLIDCLDEISEGMKFLGRQIKTDTGPLDILAVDSDGTLAILELKIKQDDEQLFQGIRYYDWVKSRIEWISRSFDKEFDYEIDVNKNPWLILVAPSFSENLKKVVRYVEPEVNLYTYSVIEIGDERKVICSDVDYGEPYEPTTVPTVEGHINWIPDRKIQELLRTAIQSFKELGIEVRPKERRISLFYDNRRIARIKCNKKSINIRNYYGPEYYNSITEIEELREYIDKYLTPLLDAP